jgi:hypothetical protein
MFVHVPIDTGHRYAAVDAPWLACADLGSEYQDRYACIFPQEPQTTIGHTLVVVEVEEMKHGRDVQDGDFIVENIEFVLRQVWSLFEKVPRTQEVVSRELVAVPEELEAELDEPWFNITGPEPVRPCPVRHQLAYVLSETTAAVEKERFRLPSHGGPAERS